MWNGDRDRELGCGMVARMWDVGCTVEFGDGAWKIVLSVVHTSIVFCMARSAYGFFFFFSVNTPWECSVNEILLRYT